MIRWAFRSVGLALLAFAIFGPIANLILWAFAERWFWPHALPSQYGFSFWARVFAPRAQLWTSLGFSVLIASLTVVISLLLAVPAGYALARRSLPARGVLMLVFLLPQAFPSLPIYMNIARLFYGVGLNGTVAGVVLVHSLHGLVLAVWIAAAAFAAVDRQQEEAARNLGAGPLRTFATVTLPAALPGLMASSIFVFLDSLDEFTATYFVGVPDITTMPLLMFNAAMGGFMLFIERFLKADVIAKIGA